MKLDFPRFVERYEHRKEAEDRFASLTARNSAIRGLVEWEPRKCGWRLVYWEVQGDLRWRLAHILSDTPEERDQFLKSMEEELDGH